MANAQQPVYEIYALLYGKNRSPRSWIAAEGGEGTMEIAWVAWLVRGESGAILVDTGADDEALLDAAKIYERARIVDLLAALDAKPEEVREIVLTHSHWDHLANLDRFPNVRVWIQEKELARAKSLIGGDVEGERGIFLSAVKQLLPVESQGRLRVIDGSASPAPGIDLCLGGGHSPGSQYVVVPTERGRAVIAGDIAFLYENIEKEAAPEGTADPPRSIEAIRAMKRTASAPGLILPGHDLTVFERFPLVNGHIARIV